MQQPTHHDWEKHDAASALIVQDEKVLLVHHKKLGVWLYPGGHVDPHETPDQTVVREVQEETGLDVEIIEERDDSLSSETEDTSALHRPYVVLCERVNDHYHVDFVYRCRVLGDPEALTHREEESHGIGWFTQEACQELELFPSFRALLKKAFLDS